MYTLLMVLSILQGSSSGGGSSGGGVIIKDNFETEAVCYEYADKIKRAVPNRYDRGPLLIATKNNWDQIKCIKMD